ncbi:lytic transglycosylase domain-containing protein [Nocardia sp. CS682]|uniref:lytic transglycosylase domain-containing protein n=1 Tax=Nocardia sp. CS682 TaxID=1047172 RepID=UPI001074E11D|nr:lytic murein transglycosylase [Nocardia sp. CS682]QBS41130.1 lytic transglycosylase [Nocardia sp. CS682]
MGRHRKQPAVTVRRSSVLALTGLVPAGLVAVTAASDVGNASQAAAAVEQHLPGDDQIAVGAKPQTLLEPAAETEFVVNKMAKPSGPPVVKSVALADNRQLAALPVGPMGVPGIAIAAYENAERILAADNPTCNMPWSMLAGIGRVESTHAYGKADADGNPLTPVYGPVLDGSLAGNNVIRDSDGGELDGLGSYDRAIGPMQFLPQTWKRYAADGNGDGIADPQNLFDAALTAGKYLCDGGLNMRDFAQQSKAILRYNNSMAYVANVMAWETSYSSGVAPRAGDLPRI